MIASSDPTPKEIRRACHEILASDTKEELAEREIEDIPIWVYHAFDPLDSYLSETF